MSNTKTQQQTHSKNRTESMSAKAVKNEAVDNDTPCDGTNTAGEGKADANITDVKEEVITLKTTSTEGNGNTVIVTNESEPDSPTDENSKTILQNHWSEAAESQLSDLIAHYQSEGYSGPILWELISSKCDFHFTAEQCMSKWYREKTKERYKTQGKKRKEPSSRTVKWDAEGTGRLSASVELVKSQEFEGAKLWNLVAESLDSKWTAAQCMNKYYRDRHKLQKLKK